MSKAKLEEHGAAIADASESGLSLGVWKHTASWRSVNMIFFTLHGEEFGSDSHRSARPYDI